MAAIGSTISLVEYKKALESLNEALNAFDRQKDLSLKIMIRDSIIQRFEFCEELSWKISMKILGLSVSAPKLAVREMARAGLIEDIQIWFDFIEARNKSSHTYDEAVARQVVEIVRKFPPEGQALLKRLESI